MDDLFRVKVGQKPGRLFQPVYNGVSWSWVSHRLKLFGQSLSLNEFHYQHTALEPTTMVVVYKFRDARMVKLFFNLELPFSLFMEPTPKQFSSVDLTRLITSFGNFEKLSTCSMANFFSNYLILPIEEDIVSRLTFEMFARWIALVHSVLISRQ